MLSAAALSVQAQATAVCAFSPSNHPFMRRIDATRFCFDPYKGIDTRRVIAAAVRSPLVKSPTSARAPLAPRSPAATRLKVAHPRIHYAVVVFKRTTSVFRAPFRVAEGDLVVVEGDRGENIGVIQSITEKQEKEVTVKIVRRASAEDREAYTKKSEDEVRSLEVIQKAASSARLNATIIDVEFQFDMQKLTVFVERATPSTFVDFRKVQRLLYRQYKCRIWCEYVDEL